MSSTTLVLAGVGACAAWLLTFFELTRLFNRPNAGRVFASELVQMLTAVTLVCLLCVSIAILTRGLDEALTVGVLAAWGIACAIFIAMFLVLGALFRRPGADAGHTDASKAAPQS